MPSPPWTKENHLAAQHEAMQLLLPWLTQCQALPLERCPRALGRNLAYHLPVMLADQIEKALCVTRNNLNGDIKTALKWYCAFLP